MKIKYLLCFLFLALCLNSLGQTSSDIENYKFKKDSVKQHIEKSTGDETRMVRLKNEFARLCFVIPEFEDGFLALQEAKIISDKLDYKEGEAMYYLTLSSFYYDQDNPISIYYRKKAQQLSNYLEEEVNDNNNFTDLPRSNLNEDVQRFQDQFNKVLARDELSNNKEIQANLLYAIAGTHYRLGYPETALTKLTEAIRLFSEIGEIYPAFHLSTIKMGSLVYLEKEEEAKKIELELIKLMSAEQDKSNLALIHSAMANGYRMQGRWSLAIEYYLKALELLDPVEDRELRIIDQYNLAIAYENYGMDSRAADNYRIAIADLEKEKDTVQLYIAYGTIVFPLIAIEKYDEAKKYMQLSLKDTIRNKDYALARYNDAQGQILKSQGKYQEAIPYFLKAEEGFRKLEGVEWAIAFMNLYLAECNFQLENYMRALEYATEALNLDSNDQVTEKATLLLSQIHENLDNLALAYQYLKDYQLLRSEKEKSEEINRIADAEIRSILDESEKTINFLEREKLKKEKESLFQRGLIISVLIVLISVVVFAIILYRNNKNKQKANAQLKRQKKKIEQTLDQLKATQSQLIQSEKMASLGELTAGIAHEIQNPLNFVNNFSEINNELLDEIAEEFEKGNHSEVRVILNDIRNNLNKINHHGKRADAIVKGMLQHSRKENSEKEPTDLNVLCDEYLRLAYHGLRAKDKSFNANLEKDFDPALEKINVMAQEIGRVILNLLTNAFYAVHQKKCQTSDPGYVPKVKILTRKKPDQVCIQVKDNGIGISQNILDKVFQPFFTTKPSGQGTGLGLYLSYEIIQVHGGELKIDTQEGEGTIFTILLPA
ncbi:tetratricopeptide repeat-containing sensor histidine kinase [Christiangramia sabulilitoris]|uniref:histidine kinase n=1 Tax=Christiangramia sabulilitoris TaxID=2583991 RepID=A0A550HZK1_9FLAO|nr:ATP-binding protein [Christiangramia sabulilitoris]TRO64163.1 tetratricopeptide repeat protein [Christiangramia sabulilitoris]